MNHNGLQIVIHNAFYRSIHVMSRKSGEYSPNEDRLENFKVAAGDGGGGYMKPLLIGLSGKSGSGKSTVGDYLTGAHGYEQFAFAGALKEVVALAFDFSEEQLERGKEKVDPRWGVSPRWCLQWLGTEVFRACWPDIWIRHLRQEILDFLGHNGQWPIVVTDVRFRDEAEALKRMGAVLVRIIRSAGEGAGATVPTPTTSPGATGIPDHLSEIDLDGWEGWDHVIDNDGSLQELAAKVEAVLARNISFPGGAAGEPAS